MFFSLSSIFLDISACVSFLSANFSFLASKTYQFYLFFPFIALLFQRFTSAISFLLLIFTFFPLFLSEWADIYLAIKFLLGLLILPFLFLSLLLFTRCVFLLLSFLLLSLLLCSKSIVHLLLVCRPAHFIYYTKSLFKVRKHKEFSSRLWLSNSLYFGWQIIISWNQSYLWKKSSSKPSISSGTYVASSLFDLIFRAKLGIRVGSAVVSSSYFDPISDPSLRQYSKICY